jgi:hypothetical protein
MRTLMNDMVGGAGKSLLKRVGLCGACALVVRVRHRVALILPQPVPRRPAC